MAAVPEITLREKTTNFGAETLYKRVGITQAEWAEMDEFLTEHLRDHLRMCARSDVPSSDPHYLTEADRKKYRRYLENIDQVTLADYDALPDCCVLPPMFANYEQYRASARHPKFPDVLQYGAGVYHFGPDELRNLKAEPKASEIDIAEHVPEADHWFAGTPNFFDLSRGSSKLPFVFVLTDVTEEHEALLAAPRKLEDVGHAYNDFPIVGVTAQEATEEKAEILKDVAYLTAEPTFRTKLPDPMVENLWRKKPDLKSMDNDQWNWLENSFDEDGKSNLVFVQYLTIDHSYINQNQTCCLFDTTNRHNFMGKIFGQNAHIVRASSQIRPGPGGFYHTHHENGRITSFNLCLGGSMVHYFTRGDGIERIRELERTKLYPDEHNPELPGGCPQFWQHNTMIYRPSYWLEVVDDVAVIHQRAGDFLVIRNGTIHCGFAGGPIATINTSWNVIYPDWFVTEFPKVLNAPVCKCDFNADNLHVENSLVAAEAVFRYACQDKSAFYSAFSEYACFPCGLEPKPEDGNMTNMRKMHFTAWRNKAQRLPRANACKNVVGRFSAQHRNELIEARRLVEQAAARLRQREQSARKTIAATSREVKKEEGEQEVVIPKASKTIAPKIRVQPAATAVVEDRVDVVKEEEPEDEAMDEQPSTSGSLRVKISKRNRRHYVRPASSRREEKLDKKRREKRKAAAESKEQEKPKHAEVVDLVSDEESEHDSIPLAKYPGAQVAVRTKKQYQEFFDDESLPSSGGEEEDSEPEPFQMENDENDRNESLAARYAEGNGDNASGSSDTFVGPRVVGGPNGGESASVANPARGVAVPSDEDEVVAETPPNKKRRT